MKTNKFTKLKQKFLILPIIVIVLFNFIMPTYSQADAGGILLTPICDILATIGDGVNWLMLFVAGETEPNFPFLTGGDAYKKIVARRAEPQNTNITSTQTVLWANKDGALNTIGFPDIRITPIEIFSNKVALLDANFFQDIDKTNYDKQKIGNTDISAAYQLKNVVASWYKALRMVAIVGLLSVLVYIGIRIVISSAAEEQAKYKEKLANWVVALFIIFFLHYIMVFTMTMVSQITDTLIGSANATNSTIKEIAVKYIDPSNNDLYIDSSGNPSQENNEAKQAAGDVGQGIANTLTGFTQTPKSGCIPYNYQTNITGYVRLLVDYEDGMRKITYTLMYLGLTFYTIYFFVIYLKRLIMLTFLTIIAPLVALTYPLDKIKDNKSQAFDYWLREYIINATLPLIHLTIYTVLISSALSLVGKLPLYALAVLLLITPAEKMVKDMFGIKEHHPLTAGALIGSNLAGNAVSSLAKKFVKGDQGGKVKGSNNKVRTVGDNESVTDSKLVGGSGIDALLGEPAGNNNSGDIDKANKPNLGNQNQTDYDQLAAWSMGNNMAPYTNTGNGNNNISTSNDQNKIPISNETRMPINNLGSTKNSRFRDKFKKLKNVPSNFGKYARKKYNIPKGKTFSTLGKRAAIGLGKGYLAGSAMIGAGALGLAGGIASGDDLSSLVTGAAGGIASGALIGKKLVNNHPADFGRQMLNGEEEAKNMAADKAFRNDSQTVAHIRDSLEKQGYKGKEAKQMTEARLNEYVQYRRAGVSDIKKMDNLHKIKEEISAGSTPETAQATTNELAQLMSTYDKSTFTDAKKTEGAAKALHNKAKNLGYSDDAADKFTNKTINYLGRANGVYKKK